MEPGQSEKLMVALSRIKKAAHKIHTKSDISPGEFMLMHAVGRTVRRESNVADRKTPDGVMISELSSMLRIAKPAVSQIVNSLETKEYVRRASTKTDRRVVYVCLTEKGKAVLSEDRKSFLALMDKISGALGKEDTDTLIRILNKLHEIITDDIQNTGSGRQ